MHNWKGENWLVIFQTFSLTASRCQHKSTICLNSNPDLARLVKNMKLGEVSPYQGQAFICIHSQNLCIINYFILENQNMANATVDFPFISCIMPPVKMYQNLFTFFNLSFIFNYLNFYNCLGILNLNYPQNVSFHLGQITYNSHRS